MKWSVGVIFAVCTVALGLVGCGKNDGTASQFGDAAAPGAGIRGEPIQGEPIVAAAPEAPVSDAAEAATAPTTAPAALSPSTAAATTAGEEGAPVPESPATLEGTPNRPLAVGFDQLASFQYTVPEGPVDTNSVTQARASQQIPDTIKSLNDRFISLKGFMLPLKVEKGLVTELLIMRDQSMCCYGTVPKINEWVSVKMVGTGVKPIMDQAVTLFGKLKVGEMYENGYLVGIYALDGDRMTGPLDL